MMKQAPISNIGPSSKGPSSQGSLKSNSSGTSSKGKVAMIAVASSLSAVILVIVLVAVVKYVLWRNVIIAIKESFGTCFGVADNEDELLKKTRMRSNFMQKFSSSIVSTDPNQNPNHEHAVLSHLVTIMDLIRAVVTHYKHKKCNLPPQATTAAATPNPNPKDTATATVPPEETNMLTGPVLSELMHTLSSSDKKGMCAAAAAAVDIDLPKNHILVDLSTGELLLTTMHKTAITTLCFTFRGTHTRREWEQVLDYRVEPSKIKGMPETALVHKGFQAIYMSIQPTLYRLMRSHNPKLVQINGQSLGAALATLAAIDLAINWTHPCDIEVVAVAGPRVGNMEFVNEIERRIEYLNPNSNPNIEIHQTSLKRDRPEAWLGGQVKLVSWLHFCNDADLVCNLPLPVMPNVLRNNIGRRTRGKPGAALLYEHVMPTTLVKFTNNVGTWSANHSLTVYKEHLTTKLASLSPDS